MLGVLSLQASGRLDERLATTAVEVEAMKEPTSRESSVVGALSEDDAALAAYQGYLWTLAGGRPAGRLRDQEPVLPGDIDAMLSEVSSGGAEIDAISTYYLKPAWEKRGALTESEAIEFPKGQETFRRYRPALRYLRAGLRSRRADADIRWERGFRLQETKFLYLQAGANLLAYEATLQSPAEAVESGLEIVALGELLSRRGTYWRASLGFVIGEIGCRSLVHTLGRADLSSADSRRVLDALATYRPASHERLLRATRLEVVVSALELSGRPLDPSGQGPIKSHINTYEVGGPFSRLSLLHEGYLLAFEETFAKCGPIADLPLAERDEALFQIRYEVALSDCPYLPDELPDVSGMIREIEEALATVRVVRVIAAARTALIEEGKLPTTIQAMAKLLGEGIVDPCGIAGKPLGYRVEGRVIQAWHAGDDGLNEGGPVKREEPKPKKRKGRKREKRSDDEGLRCELRD